MKRILKISLLLSVVALLSFGLALSSSAETVVVRDAKGRVVEKKIIRGNRTEIRSPSGRLIRVKIRKRDRIEVRDSSGRLLYVKKIKSAP